MDLAAEWRAFRDAALGELRGQLPPADDLIAAAWDGLAPEARAAVQARALRLAWTQYWPLLVGGLAAYTFAVVTLARRR